MAVVEPLGRLVLRPDKKANGAACDMCDRCFEKVNVVRVDGDAVLMCDLCLSFALY
jgi:ribosome-binding protein aMBF1 (putative translation factor)